MTGMTLDLTNDGDDLRSGNFILLLNKNFQFSYVAKYLIPGGNSKIPNAQFLKAIFKPFIKM